MQNTQPSRTHKEQRQLEKVTDTVNDLKEGHLPENRDIIEGIDQIQLTVEENKRKLTSTGQAVALDVENLLMNTKELVKEKNKGEHLQKAYYHLFKAGGAAHVQVGENTLEQLKALISPSERDRLLSELREGGISLLRIVKLLFISEEFREFTNEFFTFFSDLLQKQSKRAEKEVREEQDYFLPDENQNENPPKIPVDPLFGNENQSYHWIELPDGTYSFAPKPKSSEESSASILSPEKEDEFISRLVHMLQTIHKFPEYRHSIEFISNLISDLEDTYEDSLKAAEDVSLQKNLSSAQKRHQIESKEELLLFFDSWLGEDYSINEFLCALRKFRAIVMKDSELTNLFSDLRTFFTKSAQDSSYIQNEEQVRKDGRELIRRTRFLLQEKFRDEFSSLKKEVRYLNESFQRDNTLLQLRDNMQSLIHHLLTDSQGQLVLKPELFTDAQFILKSLFETLKNVPLPPIEREDKSGTFRLENVVVNIADLMPGQIQVFTRIDPSHPERNFLEFKLLRIRAHIRNARFEVHKREGFPKLDETGFVDVDIWGPKGMMIAFAVRPERLDADRSLFHVKGVYCGIDKLNLRLKDTKHDTLYRFLSPFINRSAKNQIESALSGQLGQFLVNLNIQLSETALKLSESMKEAVENKVEELSSSGEQRKHSSHSSSKPKSENPPLRAPMYGQQPTLF